MNPPDKDSERRQERRISETSTVTKTGPGPPQLAFSPRKSSLPEGSAMPAAQENSPSTQLFQAVYQNVTEVQRVLDGNKAIIAPLLKAKNYEGKTPLQVAFHRKDRAVIQTLLANGADIDELKEGLSNSCLCSLIDNPEYLGLARELIPLDSFKSLFEQNSVLLRAYGSKNFPFIIALIETYPKFLLELDGDGSSFLHNLILDLKRLASAPASDDDTTQIIPTIRKILQSPVMLLVLNLKNDAELTPHESLKIALAQTPEAMADPESVMNYILGAIEEVLRLYHTVLLDLKKVVTAASERPGSSVRNDMLARLKPLEDPEFQYHEIPAIFLLVTEFAQTRMGECFSPSPQGSPTRPFAVGAFLGQVARPQSCNDFLRALTLFNPYDTHATIAITHMQLNFILEKSSAADGGGRSRFLSLP
jgi:hypothetical protein